MEKSLCYFLNLLQLLNGIGSVAVKLSVGENGVVRLLHNQIITSGDFWDDASNTVVLNSIYKVGLADNYAENDGFGALYNPTTNRWELCKTPSGNYQIPNDIGLHPIDAVVIDKISGNPEFVFSIPLTIWFGSYCPSTIKVSTPDYDFIFDINYETLYTVSELDLSECGDGVEIPSDYIEYRNSNSGPTIYVSSAVKANYQDYDYIVEK